MGSKLLLMQHRFLIMRAHILQWTNTLTDSVNTRDSHKLDASTVRLVPKDDGMIP